MKLKTLQDALVEELKDIYSAEQQLVKALPLMAEKASAPQLKAGFEQHLEETFIHVTRLEQVFGLLGEQPKAETCEAMKGLLKEGQEILNEDAEPEVLDAFIIAAAQKVEHYEIATYGTLCTWAKLLGLAEVKEILGSTLAEEEATDQKLTRVAEAIVNLQAV
jgi:ferritin-like metal-binding protein YciE